MSTLVVRAPNWVGDLVMATPVLAAAAEDPRWERVAVVLRAHLAPLLEDAPLGVDLHPVASRREERATLRRLAPAAILLLTTSLRAAWTAYRAGIPVRAGAAVAGRRVLLTHAVVPATIGGRRAPTPTAHLQRDVAGLLGVAVSDLHPRLGLRPETARALEARLAEAEVTGPYVVAAPGAAFGAAKLWPPERFAAALDALAARRGLAAVVIGSAAEQGRVRAVAEASRAGAVALPIDLRELPALVAGAALVLVGDSGPRWVAAAFDVPCVTVLGPTFPGQTASSLARARVVRREDLECAPCRQRRCPLGHQRCLEQLPVEWVVAAAEELLA